MNHGPIDPSERNYSEEAKEAIDRERGELVQRLRMIKGVSAPQQLQRNAEEVAQAQAESAQRSAPRAEVVPESDNQNPLPVQSQAEDEHRDDQSSQIPQPVIVHTNSRLQAALADEHSDDED